MHLEENLSGSAEPALETSLEEEGTDVALVTTERKLSCSATHPHEAQKYYQGVSSKGSRLVAKPGGFMYTVLII
jgi:hypothetical protein